MTVVDSVAVGRLRVATTRPGVARDAAFRRRAEALVGGLDLRPPGLPDRSVLIVKHLKLASLNLTVAPDQVRAQMDAVRRGAPNPWFTQADLATESVVFADEAQLLACLTRDILAGRAGRCWWWQRVVRDLPPTVAGGLLAAWRTDPRWLPAALSQLSVGDAEHAVTVVGVRAASQVRQAMQRAFSMPDPGDPPDGGVGLEPPWRPWLPRVAAGVPPESEGLLGVALALHRAPAVASRPVFSREVAAWLRAETVGRRTGETEERAARDGPVDRRSLPGEDLLLGASQDHPAANGQGNHREPPPQDADTRSLPQGGPMEGDGLAGGPLAAVGAGAAVGPGGPLRPGAAAGPGAAVGLGVVSPGVGVGPGLAVGPGVDVDAGLAGLAPPPKPPDSLNCTEAGSPGGWAKPWGPTFRTELASLLYLVNVVVLLELTSVWPSGNGAIAPSTGWAAVELLGRHLLRRPEDPLVEDVSPAPPAGDPLVEGVSPAPPAADLIWASLPDDPLWAVLAELDGRPVGALPPAELAEGASLRLPSTWLTRWAPAPRAWEWWQHAGRVAIRDVAAGYVLADVPGPPRDAAAIAAAEVSRLRHEGVDGELRPASDPDPPSADWGNSVGAFVSWLLRSRGIWPRSFAVAGEVAVTATHVDVVFAMDDVDIAARIAGIDRDPGWVPDLGRVVLFHFLEAA